MNNPARTLVMPTVLDTTATRHRARRACVRALLCACVFLSVCAFVCVCGCACADVCLKLRKEHAKPVSQNDAAQRATYVRQC